MDFINDIASKFFSEMDSRFSATVFSEISEQAKQANPINDMLDARDRLTKVLFCNPDIYDCLSKALEKEPGFYEIIGVPHMESGQVILITDEKLKMELLRQRRKMKISKKSEKVSDGG